MENNKTYTSDIIGFVDAGKFEGQYKVSFKVEQLEELKKYATQKGYVYLDIKKTMAGKPICTVFNPRAAAAQQSGGAPVQSAPKQPTLAADDLPF